LSSRDRRSVIIVIVLAAAALGYYFWSTGNTAGDEVGKRAKAIEIIGPDGEVFILSEYLGDTVVIDFMATWCGPCELQLRELEELQDAVEDVIIVSVELDPTLSGEAFKQWAEEKGFKWFVGQSLDATRDYRISVIPTIVIVDPEGVIRYRGTYTPYEVLRDLVNEYK